MDSKIRASFLNVLVGFILGAVFVTLFQGKEQQVSSVPGRVRARRGS